MSLRPAQDADADYVTRASHQVQHPEGYQDWQSYAFSEAPELREEPGLSTPPEGVPTV